MVEAGQFTGRTARAWLRAAAADRDGRSRAATVLWLLLVAGWVVPQAAVCADGFAASAYPAAGFGVVAYLLVVACLIVALLLAALLVARRSGWRWSLAWICAVAAGMALEVKTAGVENSPWAVPSRWTWLELSAWFLAVGAAMAAILVHAPRLARRAGRGSAGKCLAGWAAAAVGVLAVCGGLAGVLAARSLPPGVTQIVPIRIIAARDAGLAGGSDALAADGTRVWVAGNRSVTELNASDGRTVRVLPAARLSIRDPAAAVADGNDLWIASDPLTGNGSITEVNTGTGKLIRIVSGPHSGIRSPSDIAIDGNHLWIAGDALDGNALVTELNATTGALIRVLPQPGSGSDDVTDITAAGSDIWIASTTETGYGSLTELNAGTGTHIRTLSGRRYGLSCPDADEICPVGITADGTRLWIASACEPGGIAAAELNASTGAVITTLRLGTYGLYPTDIAASSGRVWITSENPAGNGGTVTELNAATGQRIATILDGSRTRELVGGGPGLIAVAGRYLWIENDGPWDESTWGPTSVLTTR